MKKIGIIVCIAVLATCLTALVGCADKAQYDVVCTIYPQYDFCKKIIGEEDVSVKMLLPYGTDAHNYELKLGDKKAIAASKLFIYVGGESERWVEDVQKSTDMKAVRQICLMEECALIKLAHQEEEHVHEEGNYDDYDEHVYLSLRNAANFCQKICSELSLLYPDKSSAFAENTEKLMKEIRDLDAEYASLAEKATETLFFADRFPFRYLCRDYGFTYATPYKGCSSDTEIGIGDKIEFETSYINSMAKGVFVIENGNESLAQSVLTKKAGVIFRMNSCQTVKKEAKDTTSYVSVMQKNLDVLKEALL